MVAPVQTLPYNPATGTPKVNANPANPNQQNNISALMNGFGLGQSLQGGPPSPGQQNMQTIWDVLFPTVAPQIQQSLNQYGLIQGDLNALPTMYGQQAQNVKQSEKLGLEGLYWQGQGLDVQMGANHRATALAQAQQRIEEAQWNRQVSNQDLTQRLQELEKSQRPIEQRQLASEQASAGTSLTGGGRDTRTQLLDQFKASDIGYAQEKNNWQSQQLGQQSERLSYKERQAQLQDQHKMITIAAKQLGVSYGTIVNRANTALQQLGLDQVMTTSQLFQALSDAANGIYSPLAGIASTVLQTAGLGGVAGATDQASGGRGVTGAQGANQSQAGRNAAFGVGGTSYPGSTQAWVQQMLPDARIAAQQLGIPVADVLAQWINETGGGKNYYSGVQGTYNPAGITTLTPDEAAVGGTAGPGGFVNFPNATAGTMGYINRWNEGVYGGTRGKFAAAGGDAYRVAQAMEQSPWAAGHYGGNGLENLIRQMNLTQYD